MTTKTEIPLLSQGFTLDASPESFGTLLSSADIINDAGQLRERLQEDGYLYVPGFFPRQDIQKVRAGFLNALKIEGFLDPERPIEDAGSNDRRGWLPKDAVRDNADLHKVVFSSRLTDFYAKILGGDVRPYDHIWTRVIPPGRGTPPHCDLVYMGRGTPNVMTAWIPYADVSLAMGGLMLLEKSHQQAERLRNYLESDVDSYCLNRDSQRKHTGQLSKNPVSLREKLGGRWLTAEFRMGDLLTFGMTVVHASLDNQTSAYRMSTDTRYQLASEPIDERWIGPNTEEWAEKNRIGKIC